MGLRTGGLEKHEGRYLGGWTRVRTWAGGESADGSSGCVINYQTLSGLEQQSCVITDFLQVRVYTNLNRVSAHCIPRLKSRCQLGCVLIWRPDRGRMYSLDFWGKFSL